MKYLKDTQNRIKILIEECIDPILYSFRELEHITYNLLKFGGIEKYIVYNHFENQNFEKTELFEQYSNIKNICMKIIEHIDKNILFINLYKQQYQDNRNYSIIVIEQLLEDGLTLNEKEIKEKYFFIDSSFNYVYNFYIKKKEQTLYKLLINKIFKESVQIIDNDNIELSRDVTSGNLFDNAKRRFNLIKIKANDDGIETIEDNDYNLNNMKNILLSDILKNIDTKFRERINEIDNINYLIFIYLFFGEQAWKDIIKKIFFDNLL